MVKPKRTPPDDLVEHESPRKKTKATRILSDDEIFAISDAVGRTDVALLVRSETTAPIETLWNLGKPIAQLSGKEFSSTKELLRSWFHKARILVHPDASTTHVYVNNTYRTTIET